MVWFWTILEELWVVGCGFKRNCWYGTSMRMNGGWMTGSRFSRGVTVQVLYVFLAAFTPQPLSSTPPYVNMPFCRFRRPGVRKGLSYPPLDLTR